MKKFNFKSFPKRQNLESYPKNNANQLAVYSSVKKTQQFKLEKKNNSNKINLFYILEKILAPENKELLNSLLESKKTDLMFDKDSLSELEKAKINNEVYITTIASLEMAQMICFIFNFNIIKELDINLNTHAEMLVAYQTAKRIKTNQENRSQLVNAVLEKTEKLENIIDKYRYYLSLQTEQQINDKEVHSLELKFNINNYEKILKQFLGQSTLILIEKVILEEQIKITNINSYLGNNNQISTTSNKLNKNYKSIKKI